MADYTLESPEHYNKDWTIGNFIRDMGLGYDEGCVVKYICRYGKKGTPVEDLHKAITYIEHIINDYHVQPSLRQGISEEVQSERGGVDPIYLEFAREFDL